MPLKDKYPAQQVMFLLNIHFYSVGLFHLIKELLSEQAGRAALIRDEGKTLQQLKEDNIVHLSF